MLPYDAPLGTILGLRFEVGLLVTDLATSSNLCQHSCLYLARSGPADVCLIHAMTVAPLHHRVGDDVQVSFAVGLLVCTVDLAGSLSCVRAKASS